MSRNKLYTARIELCVTPIQFESLQKCAESESITVNQLLREIIKSFLMH